MYDLIIKNASILDGTGSDAYRSDIGIRDGRIACIADQLTGGNVIDAEGLTVSPGWIDSHSHSDRTFLSHPDQTEKVEQGITFSITGQCGRSPVPAISSEPSLETIPEYFDRITQLPQGSGAILLIGHNTLREAVMGNENRAPTAAELHQMEKLLDDGMRAGAAGLSLGLYYVPGCYAQMDEVISLAKVVARHNGVITSHLRNEADRLIESTQEFLDIIKASGCRAVFSHHKAMDKPNWGKVITTLSMINQANAEGADIYLDVYPYCASVASLASRFLPSQFHPAGTKDPLKLLDDPAVCAAAKEWARKKWGNDLSWVLITSCPGAEDLEGLTLPQAAQLLQEQDPYEAVFQIIRKSSRGGRCCFFMSCEADLEYVLKHPRTMICTDCASAAGTARYHPRLRAAFPRALARYAIDRSVVTVPEMIRKMTSLPAMVYHLNGKGRICVGADADLCIFDNKNIRDQADYTNCTKENAGLEYVIIDGQIVLKHGQYAHVRAAGIHRYNLLFKG